MLVIDSVFSEPRAIVSTAEGTKIISSDFNAHNVLWGSSSTNANGSVIEDFIEEKVNYIK